MKADKIHLEARNQLTVVRFRIILVKLIYYVQTETPVRRHPHLNADVAGGTLADSGHVVTSGRVVAGAAPLAVLAPGAERTQIPTHLPLQGERGQCKILLLPKRDRSLTEALRCGAA